MAERTVLVSVYPKGTSGEVVDARLRELSGLVDAAGGEVVGVLTQAREQPDGGLGRGALDHLAETVRTHEAGLVVFDQELKPSVLSTVQHAVEPGARVLDRTQVILDIFANRAHSREGRVQVELAQLKYLEPRLLGMRSLSRLGGGIGTRGPGETYLEMDRRKIHQRIVDLSRELDKVERQREERRQRRSRTELPLITLVGYTNVGKSTLYSRLTRRPQTAENALFVTLDPTVRRIVLPDFGPALVSDTVGFVDRLPHHLVAAFRSTLVEVRDADLIVEVVSADPAFPIGIAEQAHVIDETVRALGVGTTARLRVYSQYDRVPPGAPVPGDGLSVSSLSGQGVEELEAVLAGRLAQQHREETVEIRWNQKRAWDVVYREFVIVERRDQEEGVRLVVRGSERAFYLLRAAMDSNVFR